MHLSTSNDACTYTKQHSSNHFRALHFLDLPNCWLDTYFLRGTLPEQTSYTELRAFQSLCFCVDTNLLCFNGRFATMTNPSSGHKQKLFWKLSQIATTTSYPVIEVDSIDWYGLLSRHLCDRCSGWGCMQKRRRKVFNKGDLRLCRGAWPKNLIKTLLIC